MAATSRTESYDAVLTTTARHMQPTLRDNITRSNKLLAWLEMRGRTRRVSGGERIKVPIMWQLSTTADIFASYGQLDTTPFKSMTYWDCLSIAV